MSLCPLRRRAAAVLLVGGALAACAGSTPPAPPPCPRPAILDGAQTVERHRGPAPGELVWRATMTGFGGGCRYEGEGVRLRYAIDIAIVPGPAALAAGGGELVVPWFVAVADPSGAILDKQIFELRTEAPQGPGPKLLVEEVEQRIAGVGPGDGPGWRVYFGFDIGAEEGLRRLRERGSRP